MHCLTSLQKLSKLQPIATPLFRAPSVLVGSSFSQKNSPSPSIRFYSDTMKNKRLRWGLMGCGLICNDFTLSMRALKDQHQIYAVAEQGNKKLVDQFAEKFQLEAAYDDYKALCSDPNVDIIYVALRNRFHYPAAKLAIENGKHCIVEKPFACTPVEARELFRLAKERGTYLMEAHWTNFTPAYERLRELLSSGVIGDLVHIHACYADDIPLDRVVNKKFGGGTVLDIGVYGLNAILTAVNYQLPTKVKAVGNHYPNTNDGNEKSECTVAAALEFPGNVTASLLLTGAVPHSYQKHYNDTIYYGTKGFIKLSSMVNNPDSITVNGKKEDFSVSEDKDAGYNWVNTSGLRYQAAHVGECILSGALQSPVHKPEHTLAISECMAALHRELGKAAEPSPTIENYEFKNL